MNKITDVIYKLAILLLCLAIPYQILACQPAVPLGQMALFPGAFAKSLWLLLATVILKCGAFCFFEKQLVWWKAFLYLFIANIVTTIIGFVAVMFTHPVPACLPTFAVTYYLCLLPSDGLAKKYFSERKQKAGKYLIAFLLTLFSFLSMFFSMMAIQVGGEGKAQPYFVTVLISIYFGITFGIILTIFYEEWIVAKLSRRKDETTPFLTSVSRANFVALLFMMIITGIMVIPERIQTEFLTYLSIK